jgi:hypothetical protein
MLSEGTKITGGAMEDWKDTAWMVLFVISTTAAVALVGTVLIFRG